MSSTISETENPRHRGRPRVFADPINALIGQRVRHMRKLRQMTQADLGRELNLTFQQVQKYERGMNRISVSTLLHIAEVLNVLPELLLTGVLATKVSDSAEELPCPEFLAQQVQLLEMFCKISDPFWRTRVLEMVEMLSTAGRRDD